MGEKENKNEWQKKGKAYKKNDEGKKEDGSTPVVFEVNLQCEKCVKKIKRVLEDFKGVEDFEFDLNSNKITVKGKPDPEKLRQSIEQKKKGKVELISPLPNKDKDGDKKAEGKSPPRTELPYFPCLDEELALAMALYPEEYEDLPKASLFQPSAPPLPSLSEIEEAKHFVQRVKGSSAQDLIWRNEVSQLEEAVDVLMFCDDIPTKKKESLNMLKDEIRIMKDVLPVKADMEDALYEENILCWDYINSIKQSEKKIKEMDEKIMRLQSDRANEAANYARFKDHLKEATNSKLERAKLLDLANEVISKAEHQMELLWLSYGT